MIIICWFFKKNQKLDDGIVLSCSAFDMEYLSEIKNEDSLAWKIKGDTENISIPDVDFKRDVEFKKEINLDAD